MQPDSNPRPYRKTVSNAEKRRRRVAKGLPAYTDADIAREARRAPSKRAQQRERERLLREYVNAIKLERGCADCGYNAHPAALDFDHLPGYEKASTIAVLVNRYGYDRLVAEIAKCEVVCANCHRVRTANRRRV